MLGASGFIAFIMLLFLVLFVGVSGSDRDTRDKRNISAGFYMGGVVGCLISLIVMWVCMYSSLG